MGKFTDVKITVLKKLATGEVFQEFASGEMTPACDAVQDGREYISKMGMTMPEGFCSWAWADIQRDVAMLSMGGEFPWIKQKGFMISCCTDGLRPVVFKLERITS
jgi:uncharacterized repeat protein (TIGR04076 family)